MAKAKMGRPLSVDPSRTTKLRERFMAAMGRRVAEITREITKLVAEEDAFGLKPEHRLNLRPSDRSSPLLSNQESDRGRIDSSPVRIDSSPSLHTRFRFLTDDRKLAEFQKWFQDMVDRKLLAVDVAGDPWTADYVHSAYRKGAMRTYTDLHKSDFAKRSDFYKGSREDFLREAFLQPEAVSKLRLLATRSFEHLKTVQASMSGRVADILTEGMASGRGAYDIARRMNKVISAERWKLNRIDRTEIIHAHAEGQLDSFERLGVKEVGVMAEWQTTATPCLMCGPMEGVVLKISEARGMIPRHPNCKCAWVPANVGEPKGQTRTIVDPATGDKIKVARKRTQKQIEAAVRKSIKAEAGKGKTIATKKKQSPWVGADTKISKRAVGRMRGRRVVADKMPVDTQAPAPQLWNHQPTAVARWMGKEGWEFDDAKRVMQEMGVEVKDSTLKTQLAAGRKGKRGPAAALTDDQAKVLRDIKGGAKTPPAPTPPVKPIEPPTPPKPPPKPTPPKSTSPFPGVSKVDINEFKLMLEEYEKISDPKIRRRIQQALADWTDGATQKEIAALLRNPDPFAWTTSD